MSKAVSYCTLIVLAGLVAVISATHPDILSDKNDFLKNFINHELLNVLGVIMAITLASSGQVHLTLNEIEEKHNTENAFIRTRQNIKSASYALIVLFLISTCTVISKPLIAKDDWSQAILNGLCIIIIVWNALILISITQMIFSIKKK